MAPIQRAASLPASGDRISARAPGGNARRGRAPRAARDVVLGRAASFEGDARQMVQRARGGHAVDPRQSWSGTQAILFHVDRPDDALDPFQRFGSQSQSSRVCRIRLLNLISAENYIYER